MPRLLFYYLLFYSISFSVASTQKKKLYRWNGNYKRKPIVKNPWPWLSFCKCFISFLIFKIFLLLWFGFYSFFNSFRFPLSFYFEAISMPGHRALGGFFPSGRSDTEGPSVNNSCTAVDSLRVRGHSVKQGCNHYNTASWHPRETCSKPRSYHHGSGHSRLILARQGNGFSILRFHQDTPDPSSTPHPKKEKKKKYI